MSEVKIELVFENKPYPGYAPVYVQEGTTGEVTFPSSTGRRKANATGVIVGGKHMPTRQDVTIEKNDSITVYINSPAKNSKQALLDMFESELK